LRLVGDGVAGHRRGEAALRAEREPFGIDQGTCLIEPGLDLFRRLDPRGLGGDQARTTTLSSGTSRSGSKVPERSSSYSSSSRPGRETAPPQERAGGWVGRRRRGRCPECVPGHRRRCQRPRRQGRAPPRRFATRTPPGRVRRGRWPRHIAGRLVGPAGEAHHGLQPAGPDQLGQRWAHGAVADEVGRRGRAEEGERLHQHVGCLAGAEPAGEGHPRRGQSRPRPGLQPLHCRAPFPQPAAEA